MLRNGQLNYLILFIFWLLPGQAITQVNPDNFAEMVDFMPPPPNAASIIQNNMASVNKNTGAPNISIPFYTLKGQKLSAGISINYNSTGIKVDELSGRVGMGWALNAGGVITRTLRGSPDEKCTRILPPNPIDGTCATYTFLDRADRYYSTSGGWDAQPDLFNFSMNGLSGSFVFDASSPMKAVTITPENYIIEYDFDVNAPWNFRITANDGIKYFFGGPSATEKSKRVLTCGKTFNAYLPNSWYLIKIEHPNGEKIDLTYTTDSYKYDNGITESMSWAFICGSAEAPQRCVNNMETSGAYLSSMSNDFTKIDFTYYTAARQDITDKLLEAVRITDKNDPGTTRGRYVLYYQNYTGVTVADQYEPSFWGDVQTNKTPYLISVEEESQGIQYTRRHNFSYINPSGRARRLSYAQDHWGYYNGKSNYTMIPAPSDPTTATHFPNANADRNASEEYAKLGLLKAISFPTGGTQEILYESNQFYNVSTSTHKTVGGLRVKQINTQNPGDEISIRKYFYGEFETQNISSLRESVIPEYQTLFKKRYFVALDHAEMPMYQYCTHIGLYSNSLNSLNLYQNSPVSYTSVIENIGANGEGGATQTKFYIGEDVPGQLILGEPMLGQPLTNAAARLNGKVSEEIIYKKGLSGFFPIKKTDYTYFQDTRQHQKVMGYAVNRSRENLESSEPTCPTSSSPAGTSIDNFDMTRYEVWRYWVYLKNSTETLYDEDGLNPVTKSTEYFYEDENHLQVTKIETTDGEGRVLKTELKYPWDYRTTDAVCSTMVSKNIHTPVLNYKQSKVVSGVDIPVKEVKTIYTDAGTNNFVPGEIQTSIAGGSYVQEGTFNSYDGKGNLLQYTDRSGQVNTIIWGYGHLYPVAKITGATYLSAISHLTGGSITSLQTMDAEALRTELNKIRTGLPGAFVTTYTYKHLAGVTSVTDPNNKGSFYEYDSFNRLVLVRDQDKNVLKKICYNYQGQTEDCTSECTNTTPNWQNTETAQRCQVSGSCTYTGYMEQEQVDQNTCSPTHLQTRWVQAAYNPTGCASSGMLSMSVVNNAAVSGYVITYTKTTSPYTVYTFTVPSGGGVVGCIPSGTYNVNIHKTSGIPLALSFSINGSYVISGSADFYNIIMNTFNTANRKMTIDIAD